MPKIRLPYWQLMTMLNPYTHFALLCGIATGKTFIGSHFAIKHVMRYPELTGFIGANTYDQLSQATLRETFHWLDTYGYPYVIDAKPPREWGNHPKKFKNYKNILSVLTPSGKVATVFTRVLSDENPLRGVEFSWYWIDESRDTPRNTHDVILSRMRESGYRKGLVTSTTNGEDWVHDRFMRSKNPALYGSMHVRTIESVRAGIITQEFYDDLRSSYSPLMAAQELDALHVNVNGGQAYYNFGERNKKRRAPWGDAYPNPIRPLVVGADFNFQPAPCVWMVGQVGPPGTQWEDCIHWFAELAHVQTGSRTMASILAMRFPNFFYQIFGDASGNKGTTSNAGETDFNQIGDELNSLGCVYSIDVEQNNPLVKNRVENMNALAYSGLGRMRMTYDPVMCPLFDGDTRVVGWKKNVMRGQGKLDDNGDVNRTHATDGAGYACWKLFPPRRVVEIVDSVPSAMRQDLRGLF